DEGLAEVRDGLDKGANVIISRLDSLKPGSSVKLPANLPAAPTAPQQAAMLAQKG
ncbi:MAG: efflux RND transporter periplasmic adaptor subunit, partial [Paucibacter sp.]|nr:efflux RND transporter periplasmic adaptor subunit [Roseateles sp.]